MKIFEVSQQGLLDNHACLITSENKTSFVPLCLSLHLRSVLTIRIGHASYQARSLTMPYITYEINPVPGQQGPVAQAVLLVVLELAANLRTFIGWVRR